MDTFADWLLQQMQERDWSQADLARQSGLTRSTISYYLSEKSKSPDEAALRKIARAFKFPPETIFRAAGLLPSKPEIDEQIEEILHEAAQLSGAEREELLAYIRMKRNLREKQKS